MTGPVYMVSVVRDWAMYRRCIGNNPVCGGLQLCPLDNTQENLGIPQHYNRFLDSLQEDGWVVFCHEDWMPLEDLRPLLENLDRNALYGPVGAVLEHAPHADFIHLSGTVEQCHKDGRFRKTVRGTWTDGMADTFDCQCVIAHSATLREKGLRFDPQLSFDLYAEDFCAAAALSGVPSRILPVRCRHYSGGRLSMRFYSGLAYLREKYRRSPRRFPSPVHSRIFFGGTSTLPVYNFRPRLRERIRYFLKK